MLLCRSVQLVYILLDFFNGSRSLVMLGFSGIRSIISVNSAFMLSQYFQFCKYFVFSSGSVGVQCTVTVHWLYSGYSVQLQCIDQFYRSIELVLEIKSQEFNIIGPDNTFTSNMHYHNTLEQRLRSKNKNKSYYEVTSDQTSLVFPQYRITQFISSS